MTTMAATRHFRADGHALPAMTWTGFASAFPALRERPAAPVVQAAPARPASATVAWRTAAGSAAILLVKMSMLWAVFKPV